MDRKNLSGQLALFNMPEPEPIDLSQTWAMTGNKVWHSSNSTSIGNDTPDTPIHAGSPMAAVDRTRSVKRPRAAQAYEISGEDAWPENEQDMVDPYGRHNWADEKFEGYWTDEAVNRDYSPAYSAVQEGQNAWYLNQYEDPESASVLAPRGNLMSWADSVRANPDAHTPAERAAVKRGAELVFFDEESTKGVRDSSNMKTHAREAQRMLRARSSLPGLLAGEVSFVPEGSGREDYDEGLGEEAAPPQRLVGRFRFPQRDDHIRRIKNALSKAKRNQPQLPGFEG